MPITCSATGESAEPLANHLNKIRACIRRPCLMNRCRWLANFNLHRQNKRPPAFPPYLHDNLQATLPGHHNPAAVPDDGVRADRDFAFTRREKVRNTRAQIPERSLLASATFVPRCARTCRKQIRSHLRANEDRSVEHIRQLVNQECPASRSPLRSRRDRSVHSGYTY